MQFKIKEFRLTKTMKIIFNVYLEQKKRKTS